MNKKGNIGVVVAFLLVVIFFVVVGFFVYMSFYNKTVAVDEQVTESWAQVENQLQRRNDLIPNLVSTVKGFAAQEKEIFTEVTRLRSQWGAAKTVGEKIENANAMSGALSRLLLVSENYPQLKSNQNFLALQSQLEGTENRVAVERRRYNQAVRQKNQYCREFIGRSFCNKLDIAEPAVYFEAEEGAKSVPKVEF